MQVCEKLGDLDHKPAKLTGNAAYWAKRLPRTFASNAKVFKNEQAEAIQKSKENLDKLTAKNVKVVKKVAFPKQEIEKEKAALQRKKLELDVQRIIGSGEKKSVSDIIMITSYVLDLLPIQVVSKTRKRWVVLAKSVISHISKSLGYTASHISREMGYSDHTTVIHQLKRGFKNEELNFYVRKVARMIRLEMEGKL